MLERVIHPIPPFYDENSTILILGSFPSVKSREAMFYYGHKQNRFWKVLAAVFEEETPSDEEDKKIFLKKHKIALWDVIKECEIQGSSDSSIQEVVPNDIPYLINQSNIGTIYLNGKKAGDLFHKYIANTLNTESIVLPSTSPANAQYSLENLVKIWGTIHCS